MADRAEKIPLRHPAVLFAIVLVLLLVFILENSHQVDISFMGAHGHWPLGSALLLTAVLGICGPPSQGPPG